MNRRYVLGYIVLLAAAGVATRWLLPVSRPPSTTQPPQGDWGAMPAAGENSLPSPSVVRAWIHSSNPVLRRRGILESERLGPDGSDLCADLLKVLRPGLDVGSNRIAVARAILAVDSRTEIGSMTAGLRSAVRERRSDLTEVLLRLALQGDRVRQVADDVRSAVAMVEPGSIASCLPAAVLLHCGGSRDAFVQAVLALLDDEFDAEQTTLLMLGVAQEWDLSDPRLLERSIGALTQRTEASFVAAGVLGRTAAFLPSRTERDLRASADRGTGADEPDVLLALLMARLTRQQSDVRAAVRACAFSGPEDSFNSLTGHEAVPFVLSVDLLVDPPMLRPLSDLALSGEARERAGAMNILTVAGLRAREYGPRILQALERERRPDLRRIGAECLLFLADADLLASDRARRTLTQHYDGWRQEAFDAIVATHRARDR